jgi:hypothetical protein
MTSSNQVIDDMARAGISASRAEPFGAAQAFDDGSSVMDATVSRRRVNLSSHRNHISVLYSRAGMSWQLHFLVLLWSLAIHSHAGHALRLYIIVIKDVRLFVILAATVRKGIQDALIITSVDIGSGIRNEVVAQMRKGCFHSSWVQILGN